MNRYTVWYRMVAGGEWTLSGTREWSDQADSLALELFETYNVQAIWIERGPDK